MTIIPGTGLDSLQFGASKEQVLSMMGAPSSIVALRDDGEEWLYNDLEITLFFDKHPPQSLSSIETDNKQASLFGLHLVHCSKEHVIKQLNNIGFSNFDDFYEEERLFYPQLKLSFLFEYGEVVSIIWS